MPFFGRRVFVVEDEPLIALPLIVLLRGYGATVTTSTSLRAAMQALIDNPEFDVAALDVHLGPDISWPLADKLSTCGVPFVFLTGLSQETDIPDRLRLVPRLLKPYCEHRVANALNSLLPSSHKMLQGLPQHSLGQC
ncbi:MAG: response regulator [Hyphomicrobium sp.]|jgi:CheY-like chemotaxis protein